MSTPKHTPGPWILEINKQTTERKVYSSGATHKILGIGDVWSHRAYSPTDDPAVDECLANAHLIAASPEMADVLDRIVEEFANTGKVSEQFIRQAQAVLLKTDPDGKYGRR